VVGITIDTAAGGGAARGTTDGRGGDTHFTGAHHFGNLFEARVLHKYYKQGDEVLIASYADFSKELWGEKANEQDD